MKDLNELPEQLKNSGKKLVTIVTNYRFTVLIIIIGLSVSIALFQTRSYLDVARNESVYQEGIAKINYRVIDEETVDKFKEQQKDENIEVNSQFDPDRKDPFSE